MDEIAMKERLITIKEYYTNLEYNKNSKEEILTKISTLSEGMEFKDVNDFADRFLQTASVIKNNSSLFEFVCYHVDVVTTIINYLTNFGTRLMLDCKFEEEYEKNEAILLIMLIILNICREHQVQKFLNDAIIKNSILDGTARYKHLTNKRSNETHEMILLEDADVYAAISYMSIAGLMWDKHVAPFYLNTIWIQQPIYEKFMYLTRNNDFSFIYEWIDTPIRTFRFRRELLTAKTSDKINIVSIWSENIVIAKNLATSLNCDVAFINTHMDLCDGIVLLPYTKIFYETLHKWYKPSVDDCTKSSVHEGSTYNLFYDGMWQKPVKDTYWTHNDHLWANATSDDIKKCIDSAEKGFKIWSAKCISSRMQVLCKFASILKYNGQLQLTNVILKCLKFPHTYENSLLCSQNGGLEVTKIRKPRGVIILKEKDETALLCLLIQILMAGNSVIVICNEDFCSLAPYCDKFSTSGMSPGIVNLLSSKNIQDLESGLCATDYGNYARRFFSKDDPEKTYINLTIPKQIILPLK